MRILKITADGIPLFKERLDICFYAQQRVSQEHKNVLYPLFSNIYLNPANGFIGINASGKTSVLKLILLSIGILNNEPINHIETKDILGNSQKAVINIFFYSESNNEVCRLETIITSRQTKIDGTVYNILSEKLWSKQTNKVITRKYLLDFDGKDPIMLRSGHEDFLSDDVSIMIARNKKNREAMRVVNLLQFTNNNVLPFSDNIPTEIISYLDPTVECIQFDEKDQKRAIRLKFKGKDTIVINDPVLLNNYLSSGTIKGIISFTLTQEVLQKGGYIIIDEIENHFNKEIVTTLMRFFMDSKLNKNGGTLIFSTHYPELLDEYDRNDSIYIVRNRNGISAENLSLILKRNDMKKSDAYQSGFLEGTTPMYDAYMRLKKSMAANIRWRPMDLSEYKACICEGSAENAIVDILLDNDLLIFKRDEMLEEAVIRCRDGKHFEEKYLRKGFLNKISVIRILDSRREQFKLSKAYEHKVDVINVITAPEIEILIIINENKYKEFKKSGKKPSNYCKENLKMANVKSYSFVKNYFSDPDILLKTIKIYHQISKIRKGEYTILDLIKKQYRNWTSKERIASRVLIIFIFCKYSENKLFFKVTYTHSDKWLYANHKHLLF